MGYRPSVTCVRAGCQIWALTLISNVYVGIAERAMELAIEQCRRATSIAIPAGTVNHHPLVQHASPRSTSNSQQREPNSIASPPSGWYGADHGPAWPFHVFGFTSQP